MSDSMNLDEGQAHPTIHATFLPPACVCTWERVDDHWEMVRLVPHCVMHRYITTRDRRSSAQAVALDLAETLALADEAVDKVITDEHVEARLREVMGHTERTPQGPGPFVPDSEDDEQRRPDD